MVDLYAELTETPLVASKILNKDVHAIFQICLSNYSLQRAEYFSLWPNFSAGYPAEKMA
jgi:hypothetical protein